MRRYVHVPVMTREVLRTLDLAGGGWFVDCTLGLGGHSEKILESSPSARVLGIDRDASALDIAKDRLSRFGDRILFHHGNFKDIGEWERLLPEAPNGILADLGLSSLQLQDGRGFSFRDEGSLDMRMDCGSGRSASELIASETVEELARIFREYGEVEFPGRIAKSIAARRELSPVSTAKELADIVRDAVPRKSRPEKINPATKVFQAIRIAVNGELEGLGEFIRGAVSILAASGRIVVIAYHSLEDRIVKTVMRDLEKDCICPPRLPVCGCGRRASLRLPERNALRPSMEEVLENPSSRSARLRYAEKV
ncbi:MAG TPA: 16S rRNA (cytosine(1402)-N(4))-methyltransferase RsmH [Acidobacteriota bacterium]|nr:16S rRNA (cytosine(1402)-N(4))-methyltransferase RsmH [Acidobacteriota bacterium]HNT17347.1 16S rRNA (cytosine(1402)-N(4))-methyltransferase RsmH [Acidobacteriota bacterium]HPA27241.1 16S rRNA (cytosine(1402)-N(4))-methyltransferase RsmH [Acidobacteriota bacterium]HQO19196.1 16S rRNA (cytosine(1402)-N(4))-methyltransferase RsmH [Acidobacteriota bacterium]HQQ47118.1 16S rRNA (cytosine(1402)-N(4))-methyltransferase RsmH [Acidobacteriota bacterium]